MRGRPIVSIQAESTVGCTINVIFTLSHGLMSLPIVDVEKGRFSIDFKLDCKVTKAFLIN